MYSKTVHMAGTAHNSAMTLPLGRQISELTNSELGGMWLNYTTAHTSAVYPKRSDNLYNKNLNILHLFNYSNI